MKLSTAGLVLTMGLTGLNGYWYLTNPFRHLSEPSSMNTFTMSCTGDKCSLVPHDDGTHWSHCPEVSVSNFCLGGEMYWPDGAIQRDM